MDIDVSGPRNKATEIPLATRLTTVRKFANESPADRVLLCNTRYVVYTLTDKSRLRGIDMEIVNKSVDFDKHTAPVEAAKFMSHRSNIVGSLSANEFMVWLLEADTTQAYFTIPAARAPIRNFAWIAAATPNRPYDLAVQWGKSLATVSASDVIMANMSPAAGDVVEKLEDRFLQLQDQALEVAAEAPRQMVDLPPYVVMAAAKQEVLACGAKKERIRFVVSSGDLVSLSALTAFPQVIAAASTTAVEIFRLGAGKAIGLLKLSFPASMKVLSATCVNDQIVAIYQNSAASALHARPSFSTVEAAIARVQPTEQGLTVGHLGFKAIHARAVGVAASQFCVSQGAVEDTIALRDTSDALDIVELTERRAPPPAPLSMAAAAFVPRAMPPMAAPFGLVQSPVLPVAAGVRGGVDAVAQQAAMVTEAIKKLQGKVNEVAHVLPMDQEKNLREHMRTALQDALRRTPLAAGPAGTASAGTITADDSARISQLVVDAMTEPIATMLLGTVMNTVETLAQQKLEEQVQELLEGHIAQLRRAQVQEGQQRAQAVVEEVLSQALSTLALRNKDDVQVLMASLRNIVQPYEDTIAKYQLLVKKQQQRIASLSNPETLEELSRLRTEVKALRAAAPLGADAQINAALQRETMLTRARDLVAAGQFNEAVTMVAQQRAPDFTLTWLRSLNAAALLSALEAETAQVHPWAAAATQLMSVRDVAGARRDVEDAFSFVYEIVTKGPSMMAEDIPAFKTAAHEYMDWWTAQQPISSVRSKLKEIFVAVR